jgi:hypothetical protein
LKKREEVFKMLQFRDICLGDKKIFEKYKKNWQIENAEMSFQHLYMWGKNSWIQIAESDGFLFIKMHYKGEPALMLPPIPESLDFDYNRAIKDAICYFCQTKQEVIFYSISEPFKKYFDEYDEFERDSLRDSWDYVYSAESLITLKGKKYHSKRNFINRLKQNYPDFVYEDYKDDDYDECMALYDDWKLTHTDETIDRFDERDSIKRALLNMDYLNLKGGVIRINGKIVAFTIGGMLTNYMGHIHIEKAVNDIDGLYPAINKLFAERNFEGLTYINREEDMGLYGLRKSKESYYPVKMTEKYRYALKNKIKIYKGKLIIKKETCRCE